MPFNHSFSTTIGDTGGHFLHDLLIVISHMTKTNFAPATGCPSLDSSFAFQCSCFPVIKWPKQSNFCVCRACLSHNLHKQIPNTPHTLLQWSSFFNGAVRFRCLAHLHIPNRLLLRRPPNLLPPKDLDSTRQLRVGRFVALPKPWAIALFLSRRRFEQRASNFRKKKMNTLAAHGSYGSTLTRTTTKVPTITSSTIPPTRTQTIKNSLFYHSKSYGTTNEMWFDSNMKPKFTLACSWKRKATWPKSTATTTIDHFGPQKCGKLIMVSTRPQPWTKWMPSWTRLGLDANPWMRYSWGWKSGPWPKCEHWRQNSVRPWCTASWRDNFNHTCAVNVNCGPCRDSLAAVRACLRPMWDVPWPSTKKHHKQQVVTLSRETGVTRTGHV